MLVKNIQTDKPVTIRVGDVEFKLMKISERSMKVGIEAPRHLTIDVEAGSSPASLKEAVENAMQPMVEKKHD